MLMAGMELIRAKYNERVLAARLHGEVPQIHGPLSPCESFHWMETTGCPVSATIPSTMQLEPKVQKSHEDGTVTDQERVDEAMAESFPASDSPSWTAGLSHEQAHLSTESVPGRLAWKTDWNEVKTRLKQKFDNLTDDDFLYQQGREDEILGRLQKKLGKSREEIEDLLSK